MVKCQSDFIVRQDIPLPSDHAPVAITVHPPNVDVACLCSCAQYLGDHATLYTRVSDKPFVKQPLQLDKINVESFCDALARRDLHLLNHNNIDDYMNAISDVSYTCSRETQNESIMIPSNNQSLERWDRLLSDNDDARIWQAIDWKGEYKETNDNSICPNDEQFKFF